MELARAADAEASRRAQAQHAADAKAREAMEGSKVEVADAAERSKADVAAEAARWQGVVRSLREELQSARRAVERRDAELRGHREAFMEETARQRQLREGESTASHREREALREQLEQLRRVVRRKESTHSKEIGAVRAQLDAAVLSAAQNEAALQDRSRELMRKLTEAERRSIEAAGGLEPHRAVEELRRLQEKLAQALRARDDAVRAAILAKEQAGAAADHAAEQQQKESDLVRREAAARVKQAEDRAELAAQGEAAAREALGAARASVQSQLQDERTRRQQLEKEVADARQLAVDAGRAQSAAESRLKEAEQETARLQSQWDVDRASAREAEARRSQDKDE